MPPGHACTPTMHAPQLFMPPWPCHACLCHAYPPDYLDLRGRKTVIDVIECVLPFEQLRVHPAKVILKSRQLVRILLNPHVLLGLNINDLLFLLPTAITAAMVCRGPHTRLAFVIHIPVHVIIGII